MQSPRDVPEDGRVEADGGSCSTDGEMRLYKVLNHSEGSTLVPGEGGYNFV